LTIVNQNKAARRPPRRQPGEKDPEDPTSRADARAWFLLAQQCNSRQTSADRPDGSVETDCAIESGFIIETLPNERCSIMWHSAWTVAANRIETVDGPYLLEENLIVIFPRFDWLSTPCRERTELIKRVVNGATHEIPRRKMAQATANRIS
jgi:hypothetical protein